MLSYVTGILPDNHIQQWLRPCHSFRISVRPVTLLYYDGELTFVRRTWALHEGPTASHVYGTGDSDPCVMLRSRRGANLDV